jgi:hypothetical protein
MTIEENIQTQTENSATGRLLSVEECDACEILAEGDSLQSRRAQALLALDEGATHKQASEQAGLTLGQLKYWLKKFRNGRMTIFPEVEPAHSQPESVSPQPIVTETADAPSTEIETAQTKDQPAKKKKKAKKGKPKMKAKKGKKAKKGDKKKKSVKKSKKKKSGKKAKKSKKKKSSKKSKKKK